MFPVRYELNIYVLFRRNSLFKGSVPQFKVFPLLMFNFSDPKSVISVTNYFYLRFLSVYCSNP
jgi:hypothetical protein